MSTTQTESNFADLKWRPTRETEDTAALIEKALTEPLRRRKPSSIFVNSMSDLFHEALDDEQIDRVFAVMALCPQHTFIVLTKRTARSVAYLADQEARGYGMGIATGHILRTAEIGEGPPWPLPNVWLGASIEDQARADERAPDLLRLAALGWKVWVSYEPALGPVEWGRWLPSSVPERRADLLGNRIPRIGAIVCGGESGPGARPMHPDWARSARDACQAAGVLFHFKQWGEYVPGWSTDGDPFACANGTEIDPYDEDGGTVRAWRDRVHVWDVQTREPPGVETYYLARTSFRVGKAAAGRVLDGRTHDDLPWPVRPKKARKGKGAA